MMTGVGTREREREREGRKEDSEKIRQEKERGRRANGLALTLTLPLHWVLRMQFSDFPASRVPLIFALNHQDLKVRAQGRKDARNRLRDGVHE